MARMGEPWLRTSEQGTETKKEPFTMTIPDATFVRLRALHQEYAEKVNQLVEEDREDLIPEAVATYAESALGAIADAKAA
jgi:hypothetical protein